MLCCHPRDSQLEFSESCLFQSYLFDTVDGKHQDLKYIDSEMVSAPREPEKFFSGAWRTAQKWLETTELCFLVLSFFFYFPQMVSVLTGKFESFIKQCVIIDCRYPYEYEGGHIKVCWPHNSSAGGLKLQPGVTWVLVGLIFIQGPVDLLFLRGSCLGLDTELTRGS